MNITVRAENDSTNYSVHNPALKCGIHHLRKEYEFFTLSDRIEPHVDLRLFFTREELTELRDRITAALNIAETDKDYIHNVQPETVNV